MANILLLSPALLNSVLTASTRAAKQTALVTAMGTGTQTVSVKDGAGVEKLTATFSGSAYGSTGTFLPTTTLSSVSGAGGTPTADWTLRVTNAGGDWWQANFGAGNVWVYTIDDVPAAINAGASTTRIFCALAEDVAPPIPTPDTDWLDNNEVISTGALTPVGDESEVLFAGRRQVRTNFFWVTPFNWPWGAETQPPAGGLYGGVQWHGGWFINSSATSALWRPADAAAFGASRAWFRGTNGTMMQFMLKNLSSAGPWTDADYDFLDSDIWINYYGQQGKKVAFHWYCNITGSPITSFQGVAVPSISVARFKDALQRVAQRTTAAGIRYQDVIGLWEGPNEPDSAGAGGSWNWYNQVGTMTVAQLASQYRIASQCIKAVLPDALIMGPSYSAVDPHTSQAMFNFLTASAAGADAGYGTGAGTTGASWIDVCGQHGYYSTNQADMAGVITAYKNLKSKISLGGAGNKPFVISEWMAFNGVWPNLTESGGDTDYWFWHNHMLTAMAFDTQIFVHFSYKNPSTFGNPANTAVAARRAKRDEFVRWLTAQEITRIARVGSNIRVTRADGQSRITYGY